MCRSFRAFCLISGRNNVSRPHVASSLFFQYNTALGPPYRIIVDTNFVNFAVMNKLDLVQASMDCLYAKCMILACSPSFPCWLTISSRYHIHHGLCNGRARKIRATISSGVEVCAHLLVSICYWSLQRSAHDARFERLPCLHKGTYAVDCIVNRITQHRCYVVATCDRDLKRRIRKVPGVPIMYISQHRFTIERCPDATGVTA